MKFHTGYFFAVLFFFPLPSFALFADPESAACEELQAEIDDAMNRAVEACFPFATECRNRTTTTKCKALAARCHASMNHLSILESLYQEVCSDEEPPDPEPGPQIL